MKIATTGDNQNAQKIADLSIKLNAITDPFTGTLGALHIKDMFAMTLDAKNALHKEMMKLAIEFAKEQKSYTNDVETLASKLVKITNPLVG